MRCRACGKKMDDNSRFCPYCDCDNYPEMNQVKTKGSKPEIVKSITPTKQQPAQQKKTERSSGIGCLVLIIVAAVIITAIISLINNA